MTDGISVGLNKLGDERVVGVLNDSTILVVIEC